MRPQAGPSLARIRALAQDDNAASLRKRKKGRNGGPSFPLSTSWRGGQGVRTTKRGTGVRTQQTNPSRNPLPMQGAERRLMLVAPPTRKGAPMPVAKLSREFYERFGDKLTDELVNCLNSIEGSYRAELRDLFDAHFGRFEEKLERRLADLRVELHSTKADMLKWSVGLWVPVTLAVIGLYFKR